jgi:lytic murein transglycosylase
MMRLIITSCRCLGAALLALCFAGAGDAALAQAQRPQPVREQAFDPEFQSFLETLWLDARARGVSAATFNEAFEGVTPDAKIIGLTQKQSEFVRPIWDYVAGAASPGRVLIGQQTANEWARTLDAVEQAYDVPKGIVLGIWGMETNFGRFTGNVYVVRALATLAFVRYRGDFFRNELLTALEILEQNHIARAKMLGSWAGAMGQTQFMPTSFVKYAVDADRDGRRDIWTSTADALASTANYLRKRGWQPGLPWGFEVELPQKFDFRNQRQTFASWARLGVRRSDGNAMPRAGEASLFLPAGARGPAFLVTDNYEVIKSYNSSDAYALGVAHLGDRIYGGQPIRGDWPKDEPTLDKDEREEVQLRLASLRLYVGEADGKVGSRTREAVRQFQLRRGLVPDGYVNQAVLKELRAAR